MIQLGSIYPASVKVFDVNGNPVNCSAITLTVGFPDGSSTTYTGGTDFPNPPAVTGTYSYSLLTAQAGRHTVRWLGTGPNVALTDVFDVSEAITPSILSLAQAKRQLGMEPTYTDDDSELLDKLAALTAMIQNYKHEVIPLQTITEEHLFDNLWGGGVWPLRGAFRLWSFPVVALVSVIRADNTFTWDITQLDLDVSTGVVTLIGGPPIRGRVNITYLGGYRLIPYHYVEGASLQLQHMWETRRGPGGVGGVVGPEELQDYRHYNQLTRKVMQTLGPPRPVVA